MCINKYCCLYISRISIRQRSLKGWPKGGIPNKVEEREIEGEQEVLHVLRGCRKIKYAPWFPRYRFARSVFFPQIFLP